MKLVLTMFAISFVVHAGRGDFGDIPDRTGYQDRQQPREREELRRQIARVHVGQNVLVIPDRSVFGEVVKPFQYPKDVSERIVLAKVLSVNGEEVTVASRDLQRIFTAKVRDVLLPVNQINWYGEETYKPNDRIDVGVQVKRTLSYYDITLASGTILEMYGVDMNNEYVVLLKIDDRNEYPKEEAYFKLSGHDRLLTHASRGTVWKRLKSLIRTGKFTCEDALKKRTIRVLVGHPLI